MTHIHMGRRAAVIVAAVVCAGLTASAKAQTPNPALIPCQPSLNAPVLTEDAPVMSTEEPPASEEPVLRVVTTVSPITNIVYTIGGARISLYGLIPEGADSHTFEPRPSAAETLSQADIVFLNGLHLEQPTLDMAQANLQAGAEIVELGTLTLTEPDWVFDFSFPPENGDPNPHLWMNPLLVDRYAQIVRDTLARRDPDGAEAYAANYEAFSARLHTLDQAICDAIATIPEGQRKLLTYHDSFAYFAPRYGISVIGAVQPSDFSEPSPREMADLIDQIKNEGVTAIFGSEVYPSPVIDQIAREAGVPFVETLSDDSLPNQTDNRLYHSYLQLMVNNVTTMTVALGGDASALAAVNTANLHGPDTHVDSPHD